VAFVVVVFLVIFIFCSMRFFWSFLPCFCSFYVLVNDWVVFLVASWFGLAARLKMVELSACLCSGGGFIMVEVVVLSWWRW
jgi:hypothetical protein